jgi:hypothetical protein
MAKMKLIVRKYQGPRKAKTADSVHDGALNSDVEHGPNLLGKSHQVQHALEK